MKIFKVTDTTIRDIFQNLNPENINIRNFDEILKLIDEINFESLEVWGGASFERMLSSSFNKSPWEILSYIKSKVSKTRLQGLIGAKNLVNFDYYPEDIIKRFIRLSSKNGISIFRVYDALNDLENLKPAIEIILKNGLQCQGTVIYDSKKDTWYYINFISQLKNAGCQSVCIKDAESMLIPQKSKELFENLKEFDDFDIYLSTQNLKGLQVLNYFEAVSNGCTGIDLSFLPSTYHESSMPSIFPLILSLKEGQTHHSLNEDKVNELYGVIKKDIYPYMNKNISISSIIFNHVNKNLLPGWLILMLENQLSEIGALDKFDLVFEEILKIKKEVGSPLLSTPIGQIIGGQAILNTLISDKRWEIISDEMQSLLKGNFGKLPEEIDSDILNIFKNHEDIESISDLKNENLYENCKNDLRKYSQNEEDILSYCFFPDRTLKFLDQKKKIKSSPMGGLKKQETQVLTAEDTQKIFGTSKENVLFKGKEKIQASKDADMNSFGDLDIKKIKEIIELMENSNLEEIRIESGSLKITLSKTGIIKTETILPQKEADIKSFEKSIHDGKIKDSLHADAYVSEKEKIIDIKSPIVGTFYTSPGPGELPFVTAGKSVKKGDTLCIIEAMKLMNKINSDYEGTIEKILVLNEEPVEYNQTIMTIRVK
ncbi:MAG: acetyl-CoA carboxylase biotin carboxyl carrier protein [Actinobacteria bacterium]|nr:acetyl-CoA carboxylase biotin carboxyl carrier protein [Actinomycetota bacterium]